MTELKAFEALLNVTVCMRCDGARGNGDFVELQPRSENRFNCGRGVKSNFDKPVVWIV